MPKPLENLKPCPFCGDNEAPLVVVRRGKDGWRDRFLVLCDYEHGGCGGSSGWYHYESEAVEVWNRRATVADVEPVVHGRWVKMTGMMPPEFTGHYQCGECGWFCKKHSIKETDFDFCPGCGADMRKRNEDAE